MNNSIYKFAITAIAASLLYGCPTTVAPPVEGETVLLTVTPPTGGQVISNILDCPGACTSIHSLDEFGQAYTEVEANADSGYTFVRFENEETLCESTSQTSNGGICSVVLTEDLSVTALFELEDDNSGGGISEVISNGGFEDGLDHWVSWNSPSVVNSGVFEGTSAIRFMDKGSIGQWINVKPSTTYNLSAYLKISDSSKHVVLGVNDSNSQGIANAKANDTNYTRHELSFTTDEDTSTVEIYTWLPPSNSAMAFVDKISLSEN